MIKEKRNLIILTRCYAMCGEEDDEFVNIWKQEPSKRFASFLQETVKITVIHGCGADFPKAENEEMFEQIIEILNSETAVDETIGMLIHVAEDSTLNALRNSCESLDRKIEFVQIFGSGADKKNGYYLLRQLADKATSRKEVFSENYDEVWLLFALDWELEVKLALLHLCQTPSGARKAISNECSKSIQRSKNEFGFWKSDVQLSGDVVVVEKAIGRLAKFADDECFSSSYTEILRAVRVALLDA